MAVTAPQPIFNPLDLSTYFKQFIDFMEAIIPLCEAGTILFLDEAAEKFKFALANAHTFDSILKAVKAGYKFRNASFAAIEKMAMPHIRILCCLAQAPNLKANLLFLSVGVGKVNNRASKRTRWILRYGKPAHPIAWMRYIYVTKKNRAIFVRHCELTMDAFKASHQGKAHLEQVLLLIFSIVSNLFSSTSNYPPVIS